MARVYDVLLGGKDNFAADREAAEHVEGLLPGLRRTVRENRAFLVRAVQFAARAGIDQFVDVGAGLPTQPEVHEVARGVVPDAAVVYVDRDPMVLVHRRALMPKDKRVAVVEGDAARPVDIMADRELRAVIDWRRPVAVLFGALLHFVPDEQHPERIVGAFAHAMVPGSVLIVSHATHFAADPQMSADAARLYNENTGPLMLRDADEVARYFDPWFEVVAPGIVPAEHWHPEQPAADSSDPTSALPVLAGVCRKPHVRPVTRLPARRGKEVAAVPSPPAS